MLKLSQIILAGLLAMHLGIATARAEALVDPGADVLAEQVRIFEEQIQPLLSEYCVHCHNGCYENFRLTVGVRINVDRSLSVSWGWFPRSEYVGCGAERADRGDSCLVRRG